LTLCRKCGKEIPDGEELCEDCKNEESQMDEALFGRIDAEHE